MFSNNNGNFRFTTNNGHQQQFSYDNSSSLMKTATQNNMLRHNNPYMAQQSINHQPQFMCEPQNYSQSINNLYSPTVNQSPFGMAAGQFQMNNYQSNHCKSYSLPADFHNGGFNPTQNPTQLPPPVRTVTSASIGDIPLPYGWSMEKAPTGQSCYVNHITKTTSWEDPRKFYNLPMNQNEITNDMRVILNRIQLPSGWEEARTQTGEVYFINHSTKMTTWEDPRISIYMQQQMQSVEGRLNAATPTFTNSSSSMSSSSASLSSVSSAPNHVLYDSSNSSNQKRVSNRDALKKGLDDLQLRKNVLCKQIDDLVKQEFQIRSKLTQQEIDDVYRILSANEQQAQTLHANVNKENIAVAHIAAVNNTPVKGDSTSYLCENDNDTSLNDTNNENLDNSDMDKTLVTDTSLN